MKQLNLFSKIAVIFLFFASVAYSQSTGDSILHNSHLVAVEDSIVSEAVSTIETDTQSETVFSLIRIGLTLLVLLAAMIVIWLINKLYKKLLTLLPQKTDKYIKSLKFKGYTFLTVKQETTVILVAANVFRWFLIFLSVYLILPIVFSIFPPTREWADTLFDFLWLPFKKIFLSVWNYVPNFFSMVIIFLVFRYLIRFVRYCFKGIASGKLKISGFYPDWAMPTFHIIRILLWALAFVMIYSASPLAGSRVFAGVSVFLGVLVSLGSSSAIANIVAGLVITYMRPFKEGDRIQFGDKIGDVIEKSLLVTRLRTVKNEEITIPNSTILTGNTVNYSSFTENEGLIIHADVSMGYDNAWQDVHQALIDAALKTDKILKKPKPFVLQVSLDDFYVTYQVNAFIRDANAQEEIYSDLNKNIQDVFDERGFELLAPHYEVSRVGRERDKIVRKHESVNAQTDEGANVRTDEGTK